MWLLQHQPAACVGASWCCSQRQLLPLHLLVQQKRDLLYVGCVRKLGSNVLQQSCIRTPLWCNKGVRCDGYMGTRGCLVGLWPGPCFVACLAALHFGHRFLWAGRFAALLQPCPLHRAFPPSSSGDVCGWRGHRVAAVPVTQAQGKPALSRQRQSQERLKASLAGLCSEAQSGGEIMPECYQPCAGRGCVATPTGPRLCSSSSKEECSFPSI